MSPRAATIADLNDLLRTTFLTGKVVFTEGIAALSDDERSAVLTAVREFANFTPDNDPYGERDFGAVEVSAVGKIFWKIDYYDQTLTMGSNDAADPAKTLRVLTIMLADEY